jgi:hypothetical protein
MLTKRKEAAMKVAHSLWAAENALDEALARAAELSGVLVTARADANLSAIVGQDAFEGAAAALSTITKARGELVETHRRLTETKNQIGLRTMAVGDGDSKPPMAGARPHLQAVA